MPNPQQVTHILLDTNSMADGQFDARRFETMARICEDNELTLCVPEIVMWEWQEHATRLLGELDENVKRLRKKLAWCIPPLPPLPVSEDVGRQIHRVVVGHADLLKTTGPAAVKGLQDQILQIGPGSTKSGVKTGAADSAWIAVAVEFASEVDLLMVISADGPARAEVERRSHGDVLISSTFRDAVEVLNLAQAISGAKASELETLLMGWFSQEGALERVPDLWELARPAAQAAYFDQHDPDFYEEIQAVRPGQVVAVGISDARQLGKSQSFLALVDLQFGVTIDTAGYDSDGATDYHHYDVVNLTASGPALIGLSGGFVIEFEFDNAGGADLELDESDVAVT